MNQLFESTISPSKSLLIRAWILSSWLECPQQRQLAVKQLKDKSQAADVQLAQKAVEGFFLGEKEFQCADSGALLRFLTLRLGREKGQWLIRGSERLLVERPSLELESILTQMGVSFKKSRHSWALDSRKAHHDVKQIQVDCTRSSQFLSSLILNSWGLQAPLEIQLQGQAPFPSWGYAEMSQKLAAAAGMSIEQGAHSNQIIIQPSPQPQLTVDFWAMVEEPDLSSALSVAALGVVAGRARIHKFTQKASLQPDAVFPQLLALMGAQIVHHKECTTEFAAPDAGGRLQSLSADLSQCPDTFPILAVLCGLASGRSHLSGLGQLEHKESSRLVESIKLLELMGVTSDLSGMGAGLTLTIEGLGVVLPKGLRSGGLHGTKKTLAYQAPSDHRMLMAATVAAHAGIPISIEGPLEAVAKSFPEFMPWLLSCAQQPSVGDR